MVNKNISRFDGKQLFVIITLAIIIGAFALYPVLTGGEIKAGVMFYDKDGNKVGGVPFLFYWDEQPVESFDVKISWSASGDNINWTGFVLDGVMKIYITDLTSGTAEEERVSEPISSFEREDDVRFSYDFDVFNIGPMASAHTWRFKIYVSLTADAPDDLGRPVYAEEFEKSLSFDITWDPELNSMTLNGALIVE